MRLTRARDIARVFRGGFSLSNPYFIIKARRHDRLSVARIAFAVSRRHVASAVRRNHAKRIVRESFRRHAEMLRGYDIVVVSRRGLCGAKARELRSMLDQQWSRLISEPVRDSRRHPGPRPQLGDG